MWAGQIALDVKGELVGVAFDTAATGIDLSQALSPWTADDVDAELLPAVFTVRGPSQRGRRRELALLEYGCMLLARDRALEPVIGTLAELIADMATTNSTSVVQLPLRDFVHGDRAVLVAVESPALIGDRRLAQHSITELACWRATVDPYKSEVTRGDQAWRLMGVVTESDTMDLGLVCRQLWMMSDGLREPWAPAIHDLATNGRVITGSGASCRDAVERLLLDVD